MGRSYACKLNIYFYGKCFILFESHGVPLGDLSDGSNSEYGHSGSDEGFGEGGSSGDDGNGEDSCDEGGRGGEDGGC